MSEGTAKQCLTSTICLSSSNSMFACHKQNISVKHSDGQPDKYCARQAKFQMFAKQCLFVWPGLEDVKAMKAQWVQSRTLVSAWRVQSAIVLIKFRLQRRIQLNGQLEQSSSYVFSKAKFRTWSEPEFHWCHVVSSLIHISDRNL